MPKLRINGAELYFEEHGSGAESIVFAHGLLWSGGMFDNQINELKDRYRCISFDFRGQGRSQVTASGYDLDTLVDDVVCFIKALQCAPCHFVGLSMGGFVGLRLAIRHPELLKSLMLLATSADAEPAGNIIQTRIFSFIARWFGFSPIAQRMMPVMFGENFLNDTERAQEKEVWRKRMLANDRIGITRAAVGVSRREDIVEQLHKITLPTLILSGDQDVATVPEKSQQIHARIHGSKLVMVPGAGHTLTVEKPEVVNAALKEFLNLHAYWNDNENH